MYHARTLLIISWKASYHDALGLVSMMLHCMNVNCVAYLNLTRMLKTDCFGRTGLAHRYLAHMSWKVSLLFAIYYCDYIMMITLVHTCTNRRRVTGHQSWYL